MRTLGTVRASLLLRGLGSHKLQWGRESPEPTPSLLTAPNPSCLARVTGELTMTFPAGIVRVFSGTPPPPVLSFRLVHTSAIEHFQPNADLLFRYWRTSRGSEAGVPEAGGVQDLPACEFGLCLLGCAVRPWANHSPFRTSLFFSSPCPPTHPPPPGAHA